MNESQFEEHYDFDFDTKTFKKKQASKVHNNLRHKRGVHAVRDIHMDEELNGENQVEKPAGDPMNLFADDDVPIPKKSGSNSAAKCTSKPRKTSVKEIGANPEFIELKE